jgi:hypothetical protein
MRTTSFCDLVSVTKHVCRIFIKFDIGVLDKKLSSKPKFRESRASESVHCRASTHFYQEFQYFWKYLGEPGTADLQSTGEFHENY